MQGFEDKTPGHGLLKVLTQQRGTCTITRDISQTLVQSASSLTITSRSATNNGSIVCSLPANAGCLHPKLVGETDCVGFGSIRYMTN